jgi:hypothetical protein
MIRLKDIEIELGGKKLPAGALVAVMKYDMIANFKEVTVHACPK